MLELPDADAYDAAVERTEGIDRWCSSTDWVLPLTGSMHAQDPVVIRSDSGWGLFERGVDGEGRRILLGTDRIWGFACPIIGGPDVWVEIAAQVADQDVVVIPGLVEDGEAWNAAIRGFDPTHVLHRVGGIVRRRADLRHGADAWLARRTPRFRQRLRRIERDAAVAGLTIDDAVRDEAATGARLIARLIDIEASSWKGPEGEGLASPEMAAFYGLVLARLGTERTRCLVARLDGDDVGYIVGGVRGATYRGFQLSFSESARPLEIGHLLQFEQMRRLAAEGVGTYDLGMDMAYKERWSDTTLATTTIAATPRR